MWGTSSSEEKLAGDPGNVIEAPSIGGRRSDFFTAGKLAPGNFGLLQQYLHEADPSHVRPDVRLRGQSGSLLLTMSSSAHDPERSFEAFTRLASRPFSHTDHAMG